MIVTAGAFKICTLAFCTDMVTSTIGYRLNKWFDDSKKQRIIIANRKQNLNS
jgi:hypothetical protein